MYRYNYSFYRDQKIAENVALSKPSEQSSNQGRPDLVASKVVDGCLDRVMNNGCCTHTQGNRPKTVWWRVDMEELMTINRITITYTSERRDRFAGYHLYISDTTNTPQDGTLCYVDTSSTIDEVQLVVTHQCPFVGRYVTVYNYRTEPWRQSWYYQYAILELCEVEVCGVRCPVGKFAGDCNIDCPSECYGGNCNSLTGACFYCIPTTFGPRCEQDCSANCNNSLCDKENGYCYECVSGKYGNTCGMNCPVNCKEGLCGKDNGHCVDCFDGTYGDFCNITCPVNCENNVCEKDTGTCADCIPTTFGPRCEYDCSTNCNNSLCDKDTGYCEECVSGKYGNTCGMNCPVNCEEGLCGKDNGHCVDCIPTTFGQRCEQNCSTNCNNSLCDKDTGHCDECIPGTYGNTCGMNCPVNCKEGLCGKDNGHCVDCVPTTYGLTCEYNCSSNCQDRLCEKTDGNCTKCIAGKHGDVCDQDCPGNCKDTLCGKDSGHCIDCIPTTYGLTCDKNCSINCKERLCDKDNGFCQDCKMGFHGELCSMECNNNCTECDQQNGECTGCKPTLYGRQCDMTCGHCSSCEFDSGFCVTSCEPGYQGDYCKQKIPKQIAGPIAGAVVGVVVVGAVVIVTVIFIRRRRLNAEKEESLTDIGRSNGHQSKIYNEAKETDNFQGKCQAESIYSNVTEPGELAEVDASVYVNTNIVNGKSDVYYNPGPVGFPISTLKSLVEKKMENKAKAFEDEYKSIPSGDLHEHKIGMIDKNKTKNRFKTTFPYDHSRVILDTIGKDPHSDYINANYIDGVRKPAEYVATQGPRPATVKDFWRMIWQLKTSKIVMLTNLVEGGKPKCDKYWPNEGEPLDTPHFNIILDRERSYAFFVIRDLNVTEKTTKTVRQIHQFHYTTWPDHGTPDPNELVVFHRCVSNCEATLKGKMVVHCSAGIGRTGTFMALDALLKEGRETGRIDVKGYVNTMRKDRVNMVQTAGQYIAIHQLLIEAFDMPDTLIPKMKFHTELSALSNGGPTNQTKLRKEYQLIRSTKPNYDETDYTAALLPSNKMKNRTLSVLAVDKFRTYLQSQATCRTDYINAVSVPSYTSKTGYIVTQTPLEDTVVDLLTMIMDHNCQTLVIIKTEAIDWLPEEDEEKRIGDFKLHHKGMSSAITNVDVHEIGIENVESGLSTSVRVFHMTGWDRNTAVPQESSVLLQLLELIDSRRKSDDTKTTVVMCRDGYSQSGLFCCISNARDQMKCDEEVDIYQIVRQLLVRRPEFITNFDQYQYCYNIIKDYLDTTDVYVN
ncbi:receptor-type tyrosine-protein phosphatase T-like [Argopecten irradians]|uniref:receptor-type tyrosine-protein phosphatase T-like n=1 Tax=Argopecten irradians TaxID=31199 RepID=UPI0037188056